VLEAARRTAAAAAVVVRRVPLSRARAVFALIVRYAFFELAAVRVRTPARRLASRRKLFPLWAEKIRRESKENQG
jgi:hypothetical protein